MSGNISIKPQNKILLKVGSSSGHGVCVLSSDLTATMTVGGVPVNRKFPKGTTLEQIIREMLNPVTKPVLIEPKATLTSNASRLIYGIDESVGEVAFTLSFSQGSISTGGYRAGEATGYTINGVDGQSATIDLDAEFGAGSTVTITGSVSYDQGDQPKDSSGADFGDPLPAGSVVSNGVVFQKKPYIYTTLTGVFDRLPITTYHSSPLRISLPNGDDISSPVCKVGLPAKAKTIEVRNELLNQFVDDTGDFDETNETIDGMTYWIYTDNRGVRSGERDLIFTW